MGLLAASLSSQSDSKPASPTASQGQGHDRHGGPRHGWLVDWRKVVGGGVGGWGSLFDFYCFSIFDLFNSSKDKVHMFSFGFCIIIQKGDAIRCRLG